ncbi:hypothetical protein AB0C07_34295 [Actinoplanes missouriensis]|uniref:hypothetical protein n=1 Tax=Actinoplanes missouriensis TaxID=1866 RepID=UPI0033C06843
MNTESQPRIETSTIHRQPLAYQHPLDWRHPVDWRTRSTASTRSTGGNRSNCRHPLAGWGPSSGGNRAPPGRTRKVEIL